MKFKPGYVYVDTVASLEKIQSREGVIHGKLFKKLFNCEPSSTHLVVGGFGRVKGKGWAFNSGTLNTMPSEFQDSYRGMHQVE